MEKAIIFLILLLTILTAPPVDVPVFNVDLDGDAFHRWDQVLSNYNVEDLESFVTLVKSISPLLQSAYDSFWTSWLFNNTDYVFGTELSAELNGVANYTGIAFKDIVEVNLIYELTAYCSILVGYDQNHVPFISHNEDYSLGTSMLRKLVTRINFQKGGATVFTGVTYAGLVGSRAVHKDGAFAIVQDQRDAGGNLSQNFASLMTGGKPIFVLIRQAGEDCDNFSCAFDFLNNTQVGSPCYLGICGTQPNEGYVITRSHYQSDIVNQTFDGTYDWYLYEGNSDLNTNPPPYDIRREVANNYMRVAEQSTWNTNSVFYFMNIYPIRKERTVWNIISVPNTSFVQVKVLECAPVYDPANQIIDCTSCSPTCNQGVCSEYQGKCSCNFGFSGDYCDVLDGYTPQPTTESTSDKDNVARGISITSIVILSVVVTILLVMIFKKSKKYDKI
ncbi:n-acylethanolamine-hydrolyzing acid amidase [Anaeramoeba ignava]|uniref:N-acylethanolamine-hydrolyzing acid amidase n=1 Tax=Anaeramoeba ignava TaxID=1746090 RepID=A0A9Q0RC35_ANAIG|nr:n-acylethanolamine-hydrolyzing acid amidase [Anaeramoeba ignava]